MVPIFARWAQISGAPRRLPSPPAGVVPVRYNSLRSRLGTDPARYSVPREYRLRGGWLLWYVTSRIRM